MAYPKLLLVNDNRDVQNWGCRATSLALKSLLEEKFIIEHSIFKKNVHQKCPVYPMIISNLLRKFNMNSKADFLIRKKYLARLYPLFHIRENYLNEDLRMSVRYYFSHLKTTPFFQEIDKKITETDLIVINGEGSIIFLPSIREDFLFQAFIVELASKYYKKPVYFLNAMVSEAPDGTISALSSDFFKAYFINCRMLSCRDPESASISKNIIPKLAIKYFPDALFSRYEYVESKPGLSINGDYILPWSSEKQDYWYGRIDFSKHYICIGGSSLAPYQSNLDLIEKYIMLLTALQKIGINLFIVETCPGDNFLNTVALKTNIPLIPVETPIFASGSILAGAQVFISGRYHPSILASLGGTPCIFLKSNSHKTRSIQRVLNYDETREFNFPPDNGEISEILQLTEHYLKNNSFYRRKIKYTAKLNSHSVRQLPHILFEDYIHFSS